MITTQDMKYFKNAGKLAEFSTYIKYKVGCCIVYKNKILSTGFNKDKTDPLQKKLNSERNIPDSCPHKIHAEVDAIKNVINLDIPWDQVSIYIYRKRKSQPYGMSRPCKSCMKLIKDLGISNIYYTTNDGYAYEKIN